MQLFFLQNAPCVVKRTFSNECVYVCVLYIQYKLILITIKAISCCHDRKFAVILILLL